MRTKFLVWGVLVVVLILRFASTRVNFVNGQLLKISGVVYSEPTTSYGKVSMNLSGIRVEIKTEEEVHYGDYLTVVGRYEKGKVVGDLIEIKRSTGVFEWIRNRLVLFYKSSLAEPHSSLVAGITIGAKSNLSRNLIDRLRKTGTSHIVVASGTNVTLFGGFALSALVNILSRRKAVILTIISIWFYTFIAGLEAPIVRAAMMASIAFVGQEFGRVINTARITLFTGYIMIFFVPSWLIDVGFLLSFATTISLILLVPVFNKIVKFGPALLREDFITSLAAFIGSSPIILYFFGNFNILSPLFNMMVLWTVVPIMFIGGVGAVISFVFPTLGRLVVQAVMPLTSWFITIINLQLL